MKKLTTVLIVIILSSYSLFSQSKIENSCSGKIVEFESKILKEEKRIFISLPNDFKNRSYPTIYLIGSSPNDFRAAICQGQFITIGIENKDPKKYFIGQSNRENYLKFLTDELVPFVNEEYNACAGRYISGHSISGGFVMDVFNQWPDSFSFYIATSPAIHMLNSSIAKTVLSEPTYLYFNMGSRENYEQLENANNDLFNTLNSLKIQNLKWKFEVLTDETHETNEYTGFCRGYNFYKSFSSIPDSLLQMNIHTIVGYVNDVNKQLGNKIKIGESVFMPNILINLNTGNYENVMDAIEYIANANTDFFVDESKLMTEIADNIREKGNDTIARKAYQLIFDKTKDDSVRRKIMELDKRK